MLKALNYFFIAYIIIKPAISQLIHSFDGAGRICIALSLLIIITHINNYKFRKVLASSSVVVWGLWGIYTAFNWAFKRIDPSQTAWIYLGNQIYLVWITFVVVIYECHRNYQSVLKLILYSFIIYVIFGLLFQSDSQYENSDRQGAILGNMLPLNSLSMFAVAIFMYIKKWITFQKLSLVLGLALTAIFFVATRKALGGVFILLFFLLIAKYPLSKAKNLIYILCGFLILYTGITLIMDYTILGERIQDINESAEKYNTSGIDFLNLLGDRAYFYIRGWELFLEHPLTGIGIGNFVYLDWLELPFHTEYMAQLAENGIIGTLLYILFYITLFKQIFQAKKKGIINIELYPFLGWICTILFVSLTAWVYSFVHYYIVMGLVIGYIQKKSIENENITYYNGNWRRR